MKDVDEKIGCSCGEATEELSLNFKKSSCWYYIWRRIRFFFQACVRGFSDRQTWSLDYEIADFISVRLRRFKEVMTSYPSDITFEEWQKELDEMIWFFEHHMKNVENSDTNTKQETTRANKAKKLFLKRFDDLWW